MEFHWCFDRTGATYCVEQSKQRTGSQTTAWRPHVSQFQPDIPPGIISLHQSQWMLLVSEKRRGNGEWAVHSKCSLDFICKKKKKKKDTAEKDPQEKAGDLICWYMYACMVGPYTKLLKSTYLNVCNFCRYESFYQNKRQVVWDHGSCCLHS